MIFENNFFRFLFGQFLLLAFGNKYKFNTQSTLSVFIPKTNTVNLLRTLNGAKNFKMLSCIP